MRSRNKYNVSDKAKRTTDGIVFDSAAEMKRYADLKIMEYAGLISDLELQPRFPLLEKTPRTRRHVYTADFMYKERGRTVVEDVKGYRTTDYALRRDLFLALNTEIGFREIRRGLVKEY
jgi:hypothetical protein